LNGQIDGFDYYSTTDSEAMLISVKMEVGLLLGIY
jgi:hypothetical protein